MKKVKIKQKINVLYFKRIFDDQHVHMPVKIKETFIFSRKMKKIFCILRLST